MTWADRASYRTLGQTAKLIAKDPLVRLIEPGSRRVLSDAELLRLRVQVGLVTREAAVACAVAHGVIGWDWPGDCPDTPTQEVGMSETIDTATEDDDARTIADAHAKVEAEISAEDAAAEMDSSDPHYALGSLQGRVTEFLRTQPDVADLEEVSPDGIYGFRLAGAGDVSMTIQFTSGNILADGSQA